MPRALLVVRNVLKGWLLLVGVCLALGGIGWLLGGYRLMSVFVFCGLLLAHAAGRPLDEYRREERGPANGTVSRIGVEGGTFRRID